MHRRTAVLPIACACLVATLGEQAYSANPQSNIAIQATPGAESATGEKARSRNSPDTTSAVAVRHASLKKAEPPEPAFATLSFDLYNEIDDDIVDIAAPRQQLS
jgi:hypothetical protein